MNYGILTNDSKNVIKTIKLAKKLNCKSMQIFLGDRIKTTLKYKYPYTKEEIIENINHIVNH